MTQKNNYSIPCPFTGSREHYATPAEAERALEHLYEEAGVSAHYEEMKSRG